MFQHVVESQTADARDSRGIGQEPLSDRGNLVVATPRPAKEATTSSASPSPAPSAKAGASTRAVASWFPAWARDFADQYFAGTTCLFVLHGDVHDLTMQQPGKDKSYGSLIDFLASQLFGSWDVVLRYDLSQGLRVAAGADGERLRRMVSLLSDRIGEPKSWPRDPDVIMALLDKLIQGILLEQDAAKKISVGIILDHAQYLVPTSELSQMAGPQGARVVRLLSWAQNPYIKLSNIAICLLCDQLAEINERLISSAHVATLEVPMPDAAGARGFRDLVRRP